MSSIHHIAENGFGAGTNELYHRCLIILFFMFYLLIIPVLARLTSPLHSATFVTL
jgi:hypothetical protein